jgi:paraquat-inducible protein B
MTHFRLGLFALAAVAAMIVAAFGLGLRGNRAKAIAFHTYLDESSSGLDIGAPVKYRGVRVGYVSHVDLAPDRRHVDVTLAVFERDVVRLDLDHPPADLRAEMSSQGITGVKFIDLDFSTDPPPVLAFRLPPRYVPSRPSLVERITTRADSFTREAEGLVKDARTTLRDVDAAVADFEKQRVAEHAVALMDRAGAGVADIRRVAARVDEVAADARAFIADLDRAAKRLDGDDGLIASAHQATDAAGELGRRATGSADELERTLRDLGDAARALREFLDQLDRDPDMLVKGRARTKGP